MPSLSIRGVSLHYEDRGEGAALVLLPGALGTSETDFAPQMEHFSRRFRVIAPHPRGYGQSRPPKRDFPLDFLQRDADDDAALLDALGIRTCFALGWSDGANTAALLALARPDLVAKLVLWGGNSYLAEEDLKLYRESRSIETWSRRMRAPFEAVYGEELQPLWSAWCDAMEEMYAAGGKMFQERLTRLSQLAG